MKKPFFLYVLCVLVGFIPLNGVCDQPLFMIPELRLGLGDFENPLDVGILEQELFQGQEGPQGDLDNRLFAYNTFFGNFLLSEDVREYMAQLAYVLQIVPQDAGGLLRLLFERFSFIGGRLDQAVFRANQLRHRGESPFNAFAQALYEGIGFTASNSHARVARLLVQATLYHDLEMAFWVDVFMLRGFTEREATRAFSVMRDRIGMGEGYWRAFSWALFSQLGFSDLSVDVLLKYQEYWVQQGVASEIAFYYALYSGFGSISSSVQAQLVRRLLYHLQRGEALITAYFRVRLEYTDLSEAEISHVIARLRDLLAKEQDASIRDNAYMMALYEGFGFPCRLARAMAELNYNMFLTLGPGADPVRIFWIAAFRAMGLDGPPQEDAWTSLVAYVNQGYRARDAFERAYWECVAMPFREQGIQEIFPSADLDAFSGEERFRHLQLRVWRCCYPYVAEETLTGAVQGFFDSPSTLGGILGYLSGYIDG